MKPNDALALLRLLRFARQKITVLPPDLEDHKTTEWAREVSHYLPEFDHWDGQPKANRKAEDALGLQTTRPLPAGAVIDFCGMRAAVVDDDGGKEITVNCDDVVQRWRWTFEGRECIVISLP